MGRRKSDFDWWMDRLRTLAGLNPTPEELLHDVSRQWPKVHRVLYSRGSWTAIKLSVIAYYLDLYTVIAREHFRTICYVDAFAGSGLVKIKEHDKVLYGSPLLSILVPRERKKFDRYFFIEFDKDRFSALRFCVDSLAKRGAVELQSVKVKQGDMNKIDYGQLLAECDHSFVFLDPECTEPHWETVEYLLKLPTDFSMNFMTAGLRRTWGSLKESPSRAKALNAFFGDNSWCAARNEHDLLNIYINKIRKLGRIPITIEIRGPGMFHYHIIFAVRRTGGGNPWLKGVVRLKERIEKTSYDIFERLLDTFYGKTKPLF